MVSLAIVVSVDREKCTIMLPLLQKKPYMTNKINQCSCKEVVCSVSSIWFVICMQVENLKQSLSQEWLSDEQISQAQTLIKDTFPHICELHTAHTDDYP